MHGFWLCMVLVMFYVVHAHMRTPCDCVLLSFSVVLSSSISRHVAFVAGARSLLLRAVRVAFIWWVCMCLSLVGLVVFVVFLLCSCSRPTSA